MDPLQRRMMQEDMVQYKIFLIQPHDPVPQKSEDRLKSLIEEILAKVAHLLSQYIWQHQPFNLKYRPEKGDVPAHLEGNTHFGDNVEDEWFIVYLLKQITEAFPELAAKVEDNDGEFLLIEAAEYLPKWLNPDASENRVFIYMGEIHIVPCPTKSNTHGFPRNVVPRMSQALALLSTHPEPCRPNAKICSALSKRLQGYPEKIKSNLHRAHCFIPAGIATVLAQRPDLVAPAVSAFYLRDPVDLQACRRFKTFPPETRVLTMVTFTRCLYAQLQQQEFTPDRRGGFNLPLSSHPHYKAHVLGMKLAHGFEILCSRCILPSSEPDAPVSCNPHWKGFLESLKRNDYFRGELEGSVHYKELFRSAQEFFKHSVLSKSSILSPGEEILQVLHSCGPFNLDEMRKLESQLPQEDSDSWLDLTAQDLDQLLQEKCGASGNVASNTCSSSKQTQHIRDAKERRKAQDDKVEEEAGYSLVGVSQGLKTFLSTMSSHEGAELPWSSTTQPFSFDPDAMTSALDRLLGSKDEELDSDDLEDDDDDDDDEEVEQNEECNHIEMNGTETLNSLKSYMDQMDEELMSTNVGQSFNQPHLNKSNNSVQSSTENGLSREDGEVEHVEEFQPLDVDVNLVRNLLESLSCQDGLAGPASNLLQSLGLHLPPNSDPS